MQSEGIIAALIGVLGGGGAVKGFGKLFGPTRTRVEVRNLIEANEAEARRNRELTKRMIRLERRIRDLEKVVEKITMGELPPEYS